MNKKQNLGRVQPTTAKYVQSALVKCTRRMRVFFRIMVVADLMQFKGVAW